ncbi:MAG: acyltransferase [Anaerolineae bacterium]|nr:acyltransferase [Anaerolineae bacterium]
MPRPPRLNLKNGTSLYLPYLATFFTSDGWPVGPPWFLWVLLVFNGILALVHRIAPAGLAKLHRQPTNLVIFLVTLVAFVPLRLIGSPYWWITSLGPFDVEPIRLGLYFAYFLLGAALGTGQQWQKVAWAKHWGYWFALGIPAFFAYVFLDNGAIQLPRFVSQVTLGVTWATSCAGASLGLLGAFRKFVRRRHPIFDSLSTNSFSIYLIHYAVVLWIQFALRSVSWPAWIKFGVAFVGGLALSWGISKMVRQIPGVRRVL